MNKLAVLILLYFIGGCSVSPMAPINYYLLATPQKSETRTSLKVPDKVVHLAPIRLASYLKQENLAMLMADHRLIYSRQNIWAESIADGLKSSLLMDLNSKDEQVLFVDNKNPLVQTHTHTLLLSIEHFVATGDSQVILTGTYWINNAESNQVATQHPFSLSQDLTQDGYAQAVRQLRDLITELSHKIQTDFQGKL